jgi:hypothetical protein
MRTTISLDDGLGRAARRQARQLGLSLSAFIARALRNQLASRPPEQGPPFRLVTVKGEGPQPGVDLDRSSELLLADDETAFAGPKRS